MTIIIRTPSRALQLQGSQYSFQDCMDYTSPGLRREHSTTPSPTPSTAVGFPYLSANLQVFCLFIFFWLHKFAFFIIAQIIGP